jgi:uncharacterized repeat protein (TIGR03803 family)
MTKPQIGKRFTFAWRPSREGDRMVDLSRWKRPYAVFLLCATAVIASPAQTFKTLASFDYTDGAFPLGLIQGFDGNFYGPTDKGGTGAVNGCNVSCGSIFKITPAGVLTTVHSFDDTDGNGPTGIIQASNGNFYGTTSYGGSHSCTSYGSPGGCGTVFEMTLGGAVTTLHDFCAQNNCTDGAIPWGGVVQASDGNFYGTTAAGGTGTCNGDIGPGCGAIFRITPGGSLTLLHSFVGTDGSYPYSSLVQAANGSLYGTTSGGGANGFGTVFVITLAGKLTTLHSFSGSDGVYPYGGLVQATNRNFYGTTSGLYVTGGGPSCTGSNIGFGTIFEITSAGKLTTLHSFSNTDGAFPYHGLIQATDTNFYGATACGGANGDGTIFKISTASALTTLHNFDGTDGSFPYAGVTQATNGKFYGTTVLGGSNKDGTVFSLSVGLGGFVETDPTSGKVGAPVVILGNNLAGTTSVSFNGKTATFTIVSNTEIKTSVPAGATTGSIVVTTPSGTLKSNVAFRVTPQIKTFAPTSGSVGTVVTVTGVSLTQTTAVTFGGVKATKFTVNSDTQVTATVPTGAKSGKIGITTKGGTATSATSFTVTTL